MVHRDVAWVWVAAAAAAGLAWGVGAGCGTTGGGAGEPGPLVLTDEDLHPDDGSQEGSVPMSLGAWESDRLGPLTKDPVDWKTFELATDQRLRVHFVNGSSVFRTIVKIYKADGEPMGTLRSDGGQRPSLAGQFPAGVFHIEITSNAPEAFPYQLLVEPTKPRGE